MDPNALNMGVEDAASPAAGHPCNPERRETENMSVAGEVEKAAGEAAVWDPCTTDNLGLAYMSEHQARKGC